MMTPLHEILRRQNRRQNGTAITEGALIMLVFLVMIFGLMDFARMVWSYTLLAHGAREASRYAMVNGSSSGHTATEDQIKAMVTSNAPGLDTSNVTTTVTFTPDQSSGSTVKIAVVYNFYPIAPYIPVGPLRMKSTSQMVIY